MQSYKKNAGWRNIGGSCEPIKREGCYNTENYKNIYTMENRHSGDFALHLGFTIAKLAMKAAMVAAAFCLVKEVHKVHKSIEKKEK